jgi:hypothetical protein
MEDILESRKSETSGRVKKYDEEKPKIKDLSKLFIKKMNELSNAQKISLLYTFVTGKKPDPNLSIDRRLNRILFEQKFGKEIKETDKSINGKKKFKWPFKWRSVMNKSKKTPKQVLVLYLNARGIIETPALHPLYSSNMIIIRNHPHEVDPRAFWRLGKYQCLLIKEIDRRPVSNLDYDEIRARGDATDSDEFIIKAAMQAVIGGPKKKPINKTVIIVAGAIVVLGIILFMAYG